MGQCYSVNAKFKYSNYEEFRNHLSGILRFQRCVWNATDWDVSLEELLKRFLYDIETHYKRLKNGTFELTVSSAFEQSYSWESLMMKIFEDLTPVLRNGSFITIYPDSDYDRLVIKDGKCVQTH